MAKKSKDQVPNPNSVVNRDIIQRLNFLYQASVYLNTVAASVPTAAPPPQKKKWKKRITADQLSRNYVSAMKVVGQKTTVKMDPAVKRTLCQGCHSVLIAGSTATVRVKKSPSHTHTMVYTCTQCKETRRIPAPPCGISTGDSSSAEPMDVDDPEARNSSKGGRLPLPLRGDTGHVVFRGQEQI
ncbi:Rpr2-domain-containing protein, partial [Hymenopellis radicata]